MRLKQDADKCHASKDYSIKKQLFLDCVKYVVSLTTSQCIELMAKRRHIYNQEKEKMATLMGDEEFLLINIKNNTRRVDHDITGQHHETLVNLFQDFVLEFNRINFTNGKRKLLLFTVLKAEGDIF